MKRWVDGSRLLDGDGFQSGEHRFPDELVVYTMAKFIHRTELRTRPANWRRRDDVTIGPMRAGVDTASPRIARRRLPIGIVAQVASVALLVGCSATDAPDAPDSAERSSNAVSTIGEQRFPDVLDAEAELQSDGTWTFHATLGSPYDTPERYADAWRVVGPDGQVLAVRELLHDHAAEQPFTRSLPGVTVPEDVDVVTIEGRDQTYGWGGATTQVQLER